MLDELKSRVSGMQKGQPDDIIYVRYHVCMYVVCVCTECIYERMHFMHVCISVSMKVQC